MASIDQDLAGRPTGPIATLASWRRAWLALDANDHAIAFAKTRVGQLALLAAFALVLLATQTVSTFGLLLITFTLGGVMVLPAHRVAIITLASLAYVLLRPYRIPQWGELQARLSGEAGLAFGPMSVQVPSVVLLLVLGAGFLWTVRAMPQTAFAKRPVRTLIIAWLGVFALAMTAQTDGPFRAFIWTFAGVSISSLWMLAYAAIDIKGRSAVPFAARAGLMRPFWGGSATPIGKSWGYLQKFDAKDPDELAVTRLKALKLIVWTLILSVALKGSEWLLYDQIGLPRLEAAILSFADGTGAVRGVNWVALIANYFVDLLIISVWGHGIVATIRMLGYRIPRNTHRPLESRTLAEFWNRYFFYFKEFLVDLFFYPVFLRWFKKNTKVRIAFATFCAAALGNFLFHVTRESHVFAERTIMDGIAVFHSAIFYSLALAIGLIVSQWRGRKPKPEDGFWAYHVWPRLNVMAFFCFLKIFDDLEGDGTLLDRLQFSAHLFGLA